MLRTALVGMFILACGLQAYALCTEADAKPASVNAFADAEAIRILDTSFNKYVIPQEKLKLLASGFEWGEGPVWFADGGYLLFSDTRHSRYRTSSNSNGLARDKYGRLLVCEYTVEHRRITRTEYDGSTTVLAETYDGYKLNAPNDLTVSKDNSVWFTDPPRGLQGVAERGFHGLYRIDGATGKLTLMADDIIGPNGIAFSPDESVLYVVEGRTTPRSILAYDLVDQ